MRHLWLAELETAAESLGGSFTSRMFDIVLPSLRHSLTSGTIVVAALSIGEFQLSNLGRLSHAALSVVGRQALVKLA